MKITKVNVFVVAVTLAILSACLALLLTLAILRLSGGGYATHINVKDSVLVLSASPRGILTQSNSSRIKASPVRLTGLKRYKQSHQISSSKVVVISPPLELEK